MDEAFERDDTGIRVHERGVIAQLCSMFRSHENGLPEWFKNASTAYANDNTPTESRVLTLFAGSTPDRYRYIALLDHVGMTVEDVENRFANWGDPNAHVGSVNTDEVLEGGHGNGGKCYMTQMFETRSYLHTVRNGRASRYGFVGDDPHPGYFPNRRDGRGYPIDRANDELKRALMALGIDYGRLPEEIRTAATMRLGFTLVVGIGPKQFAGRDAAKKLVESVLHHPQMALTIEKTRIFVVIDGKPLQGYSPVVPEEIEPHDLAPDPKMIPIPAALIDPVTGESQEMTTTAGTTGQLILKTSKTSMRWSGKARHHIRFVANGRPIAFLRMENISRSTWVDRMYGECRLDSLVNFETPDRSSLAEAPLTRALEAWIREQVLEYDAEFRRLDRLSASQEERSELQQLNNLLDTWKNKLLDDPVRTNNGGSDATGGRPRRPVRPRPLPQQRPIEAVVTSAYQKAGVGVWLRLSVDFRGPDGERVSAPPFLWYSSDWAVATVDDNRIVTHAPGEVQVWIETVDHSIKSNAVRVTVLDTVRSEVQPAGISVPAGAIRQLAAVVWDRTGAEHHDVYMTWVQDDSAVVSVTSTGKLVGVKQGETQVYAVDEQCMAAATPTSVVVTPAETAKGDRSGAGYPRVLLSEVDADPLNPDGESVHLSPDDGPVHQPTPQHVEHNIWWINLQCPLARLYFEEYGPRSREWRTYHIERYIEALAKIRLSRDFQLAEEELTFDEVERRWREVASEVQRRALEDLRPLLEGEAN